jgi:hypothetical protein
MKSIRGKILIAMLSVAICSVALVSIVCFANLNTMRSHVVAMSDALGDQAAEDSSAAMTEQAMEQLTQIAEEKANYADEKMGKQQMYTYMVADYLQQLYTDPENYTSRIAYAPDPELDGTLSAQLLYFNESIDPQ